MRLKSHGAKGAGALHSPLLLRLALLGLRIKLPVSRQLIPVVLPVMPGLLDLLKVEVLAVQQHFSQDTLIASRCGA